MTRLSDEELAFWAGLRELLTLTSCQRAARSMAAELRQSRAEALTGDDIEGLRRARTCVQGSLMRLHMSTSGHGKPDETWHEVALAAIDKVLATTKGEP